MSNILGDFIKKYRSQKDLSLREFGRQADISHTHIDSIERGIDPRTGKTVKITNETLQKLAKATNTDPAFLFELSLGKSSDDNPTPPDTIASSLSDEPELFEFWNQLKEREDLQLFFKQTKDMSPADIKKVMRVIKAIEDEEAEDDSL